MSSHAQSSAGKKNNLTFLVSFVETFQTKLFREKLNNFSMNMKGSLRWAVRGKTAPSQKMAAVLKGEAERRNAASFASNFATGDAPLL